MQKITRLIIQDLLRNWSLWVYTLFLMGSCFGLFYLEGPDSKAMLSILNVILLLVPAFCLIFSIVYYFNSIDFILLLLAQPIRRSSIIISFVTALSTVFVAAVWVGAGIPLLILGPGTTALIIITAGTYLSVIFVSLSIFIGVFTREKSQGLGLSLLLWFYFIILFDGIVLLLMYAFNEYPIEKIAVYITFLNPVDLSRILTIMHTDAAALMGYTGAVFQKFFGTSAGTAVSLTLLTIWAFVPIAMSIRKFRRRSF